MGFGNAPRKNICFVAAVDSTVTAFLVDQLRELSQRYGVTVVTNTADPGFLARLGVEAEAVSVGIRRRISPAHDVLALARLAMFFRARRFDAVHSVTPKAGLLAMTAAAAACVPVRIHTFTGQVWVTSIGLRRALLKCADRFTAAAATTVLADSESQRAFLEQEGVVKQGRVTVLGSGSISGVDVDRFRPNPEVRHEVRRELGVPKQATVFLFVGRLNRDKGVLDLCEAFEAHAVRNPASVLVVVGPDEERVQGRMQSALRLGRCVFVPFTTSPERFMAAADVLCLPSYREGFGSVIIEAAACGIPAIASRVYGVVDAVVDGVTGILHAPGAIGEIAACMDIMCRDGALRARLASAARLRATTLFPKERLTNEVVELYGTLVR